MFLLDPIEAFERRFHKIDEGYLYYPSNTAGGYLITEEEHQELRNRWKQVAGSRGLNKLVLVCVGLISVGILAGEVFNLSEDFELWAPPIIAVAVVGYLWWKNGATRRLIRTRDPVRPPRSGAEIRRSFVENLGTWRYAAGIAIFAAVLVVGLTELGTNPVFGVPLTLVGGYITAFGGWTLGRYLYENR